MIRSFRYMGLSFVRLGRNLGNAGYVFGRSIGRSFVRFGIEFACAVRGCDGEDGNCCR